MNKPLTLDDLLTARDNARKAMAFLKETTREYKRAANVETFLTASIMKRIHSS